MVPFMVDRLWRAVSMGFSGRVNILFTHTSTIKNSSSNIVFNSSLGHFCSLVVPEICEVPALLAEDN